MSGGVDSSVSALLLKQQGYEVIGLYMKNWEEVDPTGVCSADRDFQDVAAVCHQIGIPYYTVNFTREYQESVFLHFLADLKLGKTPNPDVLCNREIKFKALLQKAISLGADLLATGHYARIDDEYRLLRGRDLSKDQSYFLYTLDQKTLSRVLFPIGGLEKQEVRKIAEKYRLPTAKKKDSTGICFIGKRDFRQFIAGYLPYQPGNFMTMTGEVVGQHVGVAFYTIGQRKGLGLGGAGSAWFVVKKDISRNVVYVGQGADHPALYASELAIEDIAWVAGQPARQQRAGQCTAKIRYRQADQPCHISDGVTETIVRFTTPQRAITPGQAIVFYDGEFCLGGGSIVNVLS
jgi:tRNA-specific 2-thiouridylase